MRFAGRGRAASGRFTCDEGGDSANEAPAPSWIRCAARRRSLEHHRLHADAHHHRAAASRRRACLRRGTGKTAMTLTEMRRLLDDRGILLTKSLGQNFLHDANQLRRIVAAAEL